MRVLLAETAGSGEDLASDFVIPSSYYLLDSTGRTYAPTGYGWSQAATDPAEREGTAPPGQIADFQLIFPGMPREVTGLTLVLDDVKTEDGMSYDLRLPVPLPKTEGSSADS